jgi:hypothetical protein
MFFLPAVEKPEHVLRKSRNGLFPGSSVYQFSLQFKQKHLLSFKLFHFKIFEFLVAASLIALPLRLRREIFGGSGTAAVGLLPENQGYTY